MCASRAAGTDWICFCRSSFLLLHDMFLHFSIYPTFVPFETEIVSSKIRKGNNPMVGATVAVAVAVAESRK